MPPNRKSIQNGDGLDILTVIVEFRCVVKDQNRGIGRDELISGGLEMPAKLSTSLTLGLARKRYAALVFAQL
jgi:hypothetical protein